MAAITVPNTFSNGTAADATAVNANFDAITDGLSDGTKDITVSAATINGALTANGAVTLGNATGDDIIVTGRVAADFDPKTASTYDMGDATQLWKGVYANDAFLDRGAVGTPSHSFHADTDTGMWSSGANVLDFAVNGSNRLTLTTTTATFTGSLTTAGGSFDGAVVINEAGADVDFRVEGDTQTHLLFADASTGRIGINTDTPEAQLHIFQTSAGQSAHADADNLQIEGDTVGISLLSGTAATGNIFFGDSDDQDAGRLVYDHSTNSMGVYTAGGLRFRVASSGTISITGGGTFEMDPVNTTATAANATWISTGGGNYALQRSTSALKYKTEVQELTHDEMMSAFDMRPISYTSKIKSDAGARHLGFVAEDVETVESRLVTRSAEGELEGVSYGRVTVINNAAIQYIKTRLDAMEAWMKRADKGGFQPALI